MHARLTPETRGIVGPDDLARMKPTALIVNVSRAELIAPGALLAALRTGRPGYAAVDVYEEEPVTDGNHPFLKMPNVLCTPHLGWAEWDNFELYFRECFEQIVAFEKGEPLRLGNPDVKAAPVILNRHSGAEGGRQVFDARAPEGPKAQMTDQMLSSNSPLISTGMPCGNSADRRPTRVLVEFRPNSS